MNARAIVITCVSLLSGGLANAGVGPFRDGDRVCFVGDSITKQGGYHAQILLFYATRYPDLRLQTWNCGIAGDTATGGLKRYDWDIAPHQPTVVTVMMGMNDVNRGLYARQDVDQTVLDRRQQAIDRNVASMTGFVRRATEDGARVILITPSLYDQTGTQETPCLFGVNDALAACAEGARRLAGEYQEAGIVEFNPPMAAINAAGQAKDPAFTLIGPDRVHPGAAGHLVMAYLFLKAQGVSGTVASMGFDVDTKTVLVQDNCAVSKAAFTEDRVAFDCLERALPFPVSPTSGGALELVPFQEELNREILQVEHLAEGTYEVRIDGKTVLGTTSAALATGINLATITDTPQYQQALAVQRLVTKRHELETKLRTYALLKQQFFPDLENPTPEIEQEILRSNHAKLVGKDDVWSTYRRNMIEDYLRTTGGKEAVAVQRDELMTQIYTANQPVLHHYEIVRTGGL